MEMIAPFNRSNPNDILLLNYIKRELPEALSKMKVIIRKESKKETKRERDEELNNILAEQLSKYIKSNGVCLTSLEKIQFNENLTPEEHKEFEEYLDQVIRIKLLSNSKKGMDFKTFVGNAWANVVHIMGTDKATSADDNGSGGGGVRG